MPEELIPVLVVFIVVGIPVICGTLVKLAKIMRGETEEEPKRKRRQGKHEPSMNDADETRLIQEIHRGLTRLENRIDAIETIVLQGESKRPTSTHHE